MDNFKLTSQIEQIVNQLLIETNLANIPSNMSNNGTPFLPPPKLGTNSSNANSANNGIMPGTYGVITGQTDVLVYNEANLSSSVKTTLPTGQRFLIGAVTGEFYFLEQPVSGFILINRTWVPPQIFTVSQALVEFCASYQDFQAEPYRNANGDWCVGYGENFGQTKPTSVTQEQALTWLQNQLNTNYAPIVATINTELNLGFTQSQFDAITDFIFSAGQEAWVSSCHNGGLGSAIIMCASPQTIMDQFRFWDTVNNRYCQQTWDRRTQEGMMFLYDQYKNYT